MRGVIDPSKPIIPISYAGLLVNLVAQWGVSRDELLTDTGISDAKLTDPDAKVTPLQHRKLITRAYELTGEPGLGFHAGLQLKLSAHGFLGFAVMTSATLREAGQIAEKYFKTRSQILEFRLFEEGDTAVVQVDEVLALDEHLPFVIESLFMGLYLMASHMVGEAIADGEARVTYSKPDYFSRYQHFMPGETKFDCASNQLRFPAHFLDRKLSMADPIAAKLAIQQCEKELAAMSQDENLLPRVRRILLRCEGQFPQLEQMASLVHTSPRTLKRQLARLNTTYQEVLDNVRKGLAVEHLQQSQMTVEDIAYRLGFNDPSNFTRAFKKWTGFPPSHYRTK